MFAGLRMTRVICVFSVLPVAGLVTQAFFSLTAFTLGLPPCVLTIFRLGSPSKVSTGNAPASKRRFMRYARFLPPEGFLLCRSPCQTDILCTRPNGNMQSTEKRDIKLIVCVSWEVFCCALLRDAGLDPVHYMILLGSKYDSNMNSTWVVSAHTAVD